MQWWWNNTLRGTQQDKQVFVGFLERHAIPPQGHLKEILSADWQWAWRYLAYAVKRYPNHGGILRKLNKLANVQAGGRTPQERVNNIDKDYKTGLLEFKALYALSSLGHRLVEADVKVGGAGGNQNRDCDWLVEKGGRLFRVEVRRWCGDILSQKPLKGGGRRFKPMPGKDRDEFYMGYDWQVGEWLRGQCEEVAKKKADMLVCHLPGGTWDIDEAPPHAIPFSSRSLRAYCEEILPDALGWHRSGPTWIRNIPRSGNVEQIIDVKPKGWWLLKVDQRRNTHLI